MKSIETPLFALTLLVVPLLAWIAGRAMGRRDWRIAPVIVMSMLVALLPNLARLLTLALIDGRPFGEATAALIQRALGSAEIGFFFAALSVFMTMLGWTSTPVVSRPD
jgi:hypothetical protein